MMIQKIKEGTGRWLAKQELIMPYKDLKVRKKFQRKYQRERAARLKKEWLSANGPCVACRTQTNLEVDHISSKTSLGSHIWSRSEQHRIEELKKCQVLCHECHRKKSRWQLMSRGHHGTVSMYGRYKCRCPACKEAKRIETAKYK